MRTKFLAPVLLFIGVVGAWEGICREGWVSAYLVASPSEILAALRGDAGELFSAFGLTAASALLGFVASASIGIAWALLLISSDLAYLAFYPYAVVFQTIPIIAVAPLLVIWFGYGPPTVIVSAFLASIFPVIMATLSGLRATGPELRDLFRLYQATWGATLIKLIIPMALPHILTGLRIGAGLAVIGAIVGEFVGGGGLGSVIDMARTQQRVDIVFAAVFLACVLGALAIFAIDMLSGFVLSRWSRSAK